MTYSEKLRDPRWQKKRLEVLQAAEWMCSNCGDESNTLNVHHKRYVRGRDPWEYDIEELQSLCEFCHGAMHSAKACLESAVSRLSPEDVRRVAGYACGLVCAAEDVGYITFENHFEQPDMGEVVAGMADFIGSDVPTLAEYCVGCRFDFSIAMAAINSRQKKKTDA